MKRIGMLKVSSHSCLFGGLFNDFNLEQMKELDRPAPILLALEEEPRIPLGGARITYIWDPDRQKAEKFASVCSVEAVADSPTAMIGKVDAILLSETTGNGNDHAALALPFLEAGIPIFVDKPFSNNIPDAYKMVETAEKTGAPLMSSSLLRYVKAVEELHAEAQTIGDIRHIVASGPGDDTLIYGIHTCELMIAAFKCGVETVDNFGHRFLDLAYLRFSDGKTGVMQILRRAPIDFTITIYGVKGVQSRNVPFLSYRYGAALMMQEFVKMLETGRPPIPYQDTLEILKILLATRLSLAEGRRVQLAEL